MIFYVWNFVKIFVVIIGNEKVIVIYGIFENEFSLWKVIGFGVMIFILFVGFVGFLKGIVGFVKLVVFEIGK